MLYIPYIICDFLPHYMQDQQDWAVVVGADTIVVGVAWHLHCVCGTMYTVVCSNLATSG